MQLRRPSEHHEAKGGVDTPIVVSFAHVSIRCGMLGLRWNGSGIPIFVASSTSSQRR
jgi:hypothetical protein